MMLGKMTYSSQNITRGGPSSASWDAPIVVFVKKYKISCESVEPAPLPHRPKCYWVYR